MNEKSIDPGSEIPTEKKPVEKTAEQIEAEKQAENKRVAVAEISSARVKVIVETTNVKICGCDYSVLKGHEVSVAQSVRNPDAIVVHLAGDNARIFGTGKNWTMEKIYEVFGMERFMEISDIIRAWDAMVNELAIMELPE
jgi:hypothetical protein